MASSSGTFSPELDQLPPAWFPPMEVLPQVHGPWPDTASYGQPPASWPHGAELGYSGELFLQNWAGVWDGVLQEGWNLFLLQILSPFGIPERLDMH